MHCKPFCTAAKKEREEWVYRMVWLTLLMGKKKSMYTVLQTQAKKAGQKMFKRLSPVYSVASIKEFLNL